MFKFSNDEKHRESLAMLRETLDYLRRLPPNAITREFCEKIEAHLDDPSHKLMAAQRQSRTKSLYTAAGVEWLNLTLQGQTVTVKLAPVSTDYRTAPAHLEQTAISCLRAGCVVDMSAAPPHC